MSAGPSGSGGTTPPPARSRAKGKSAGRQARAVFRCGECGWTAPRWVGRCGECQQWGTVGEVDAAPTGITQARVAATPARPIAEIECDAAAVWPTGVGELDRVLGGGMVSGAVVLLAGEPGVGKSTLLLDVASRAASSARTVLYVTGEESAAQVRMRAERIGALRPRLLLAAETDLATVLGHVEANSPDLLVVDSVQTIASDAVDGTAGNVTQVREVAASLIRVAKTRGMATVLVGHVTKDGSIAGPRVLEHLVDVVCQFEGDRHSRLRLVRATKNRYGPTDEVGCFDLTETGIVGLTDPSGLFLSRHAAPVPGTSVTVTLEGRRPLVAEVQALVAKSALSNPRRATSGLDSSRVSMVLAVLDRRLGVNLLGMDTYVATVGGVRLGEPSSDLAVALAVASAAADQPLRSGLVAIGEVGLAGEVRAVADVGRRLAEAARLGFTRAIVPAGTDRCAPDGMAVVEAADLLTALEVALTRQKTATGPKPVHGPKVVPDLKVVPAPQPLGPNAG
jgi:DNA repair protein RadA/Sms